MSTLGLRIFRMAREGVPALYGTLQHTFDTLWGSPAHREAQLLTVRLGTATTLQQVFDTSNEHEAYVLYSYGHPILRSELTYPNKGRGTFIVLDVPPKERHSTRARLNLVLERAGLPAHTYVKDGVLWMRVHDQDRPLQPIRFPKAGVIRGGTQLVVDQARMGGAMQTAWFHDQVRPETEV